MNYEEYEELEKFLLDEYVLNFIALDSELREKRKTLYDNYKEKRKTLYAKYREDDMASNAQYQVKSDN